ncbi:MAG TPA: OB-fold domain-containing protein, partial [Burkholderiaceae bacterium]|nr:OB-fold domain-containing protein [Burkholderiaceae bacterium]
MTPTDTRLPAPPVNDLTRPFWDALKNDGALTFQRCTSCGHAWLPARSDCPSCLGDQWSREASKGLGTLVSWVVYRHAYDPAFEARLPYTVAVVQLDEGPRLISYVVGVDPASLRIDQRLRLVVEDEN